MEVLGLVHRCLLFQINKQRYLYGATATLAQDPSAIRKLKVQYIILPNQPYNIDHSLYQWHISLVSLITPTPVIVTIDNFTRVRLEQISEGLNIYNIKWELLSLHEVKLNQLQDAFNEEMEKLSVAPLLKEPHGMGMNQGWGRMSIVVPEHGRGMWLVHQSQLICIDPSEQIEAQMMYYGMPLSCLKAVLLTSSASLNCLQLILKLPRLSVIAEKQVYGELMLQLKSHTCLPDQTLRAAVRGKIITHTNKKHQFRGYKLSVARNQRNETTHWDIGFGQLLVRLYPKQIDFFPPQVIHNSAINYFIAYQIQDKVKHQLQKIPEVYRKKIIFNRVSRKYNNKYFLTLRSGQEVVALPAVSKYNQPPSDLCFAFKQQDSRGQLKCKTMKAGEYFNSSQRVVYVRKGYVRDQQDRLYSPGSAIPYSNKVRSEGNATIMYQTHAQLFFYQGAKQASLPQPALPDDLLKKCRQNSFVKQVIQVCENQKKTNLLERSGDKEHEQGQVEFESESLWWKLNKICHVRTFESGEECHCGNNLYLIIKGCLKFRGEEALASKQMAIGSVRSYYCPAYKDEDLMDVVKDTWAVQIPVAALHRELLSSWPDILYRLFIRDPIFD